MKCHCYGFVLGFCLLVLQTIAQKPSFTFADTYPTSNLDSLENWLRIHPQPTEERLLNLIRAERTFFFTYPENMGDHLAEIKTLSTRLRSFVGLITHGYLEARVFMRNENRISAYKGLRKSYNNFMNLKDSSGIIHAAAGLVEVHYGANGNRICDDISAEEYLKKAETIQKKSPNVHDAFMLVIAYCIHKKGSANPDYKTILTYVRPYLSVCEAQSLYSYAWFQLINDISICYHYQHDYETALKINKQILIRLKANQLYLRIRTMYNQSLTLGSLQRDGEQLQICKEAFVLLEKLAQKAPYPEMYYNLCFILQHKYNMLGNFKKAYSYPSQFLDINDEINDIQQNEELTFLTKKYQLSEEQRQIMELTLQKHNLENLNRFILTLLGIAVVIAAGFGYIIWRLRQSNARLNTVVLLRDEFIRFIAHDLRRPLHAFYGLSEVFSKLLQRGDQQSIIKLSHSIDQSSLYIRQLIDNLVYWAFSQKENLSLNITTFNLRPSLEALKSVYGGVAALKGIELKLTCPADLTVHTDSNALDLILRNLIDNATQHTPVQGSVWIEVLPNTEPNQVNIRVSDTGKGMTDAQLQLVQDVLNTPQHFQPKQDNLGLGLIIVSTFAKQAKIVISVESQEGKGTTFWIRLPKEN